MILEAIQRQSSFNLVHLETLFKIDVFPDLTRIAEKGNLALSEKQKDFLDEVTTFNIKARYPDYKNRFYRKATREFTEIYISKIREFRLWLIKEIRK
jgi:HEPN domain